VVKDKFDLFLEDVDKQVRSGKVNYLGILRLIDLEYKTSFLKK